VLARSICILLVVVCGVFAVALPADQASPHVSAQASASVGDGVEVSAGTFVVERGARVAVEIVRDDPCVCLCVPIDVRELVLLDAVGMEIYGERYDEGVDRADWLGRISLIDPDDGELLPEGSYTVRVETSVGRFSARIDIVSSSMMTDPRRSSASASACGLALRLYRLIVQEDHGAAVSLRVGDRLMVALTGNSTTGYQWENALLYEYAVLRETQSAEYRASTHPEGMVGVGGEFLFRYEAADVGPQAFRFIYHQPWASVQPAAVVEFDVTVY
jgi:inhibitor of cysteine peptidase